MNAFHLARTYLCPFVLLLSAFAACSSTENFPGLSSRGILPLSDSDPLFGSNLFLSKEMEKSPYLFSFIKTHGAPTAIEIAHESIEATKLIMFYAREKQVYVAVPVDRQLSRQWIIRGPFPIEWRDNKRVQPVQTAWINEPPFRLWGRDYRFPILSAEHAPQKVLTPAIPAIPARTPAPAKKKPSKKIIVAKGESIEEKVDPATFHPLNTDQQALRMAQGYAERADNGDLIHTVKAGDDTPDKIARWYTGSSKYAAEIAKLNNVPQNQPCTAGARIRIPLSMLKQLKVLPENFR
jgi:hypothetical protein